MFSTFHARISEHFVEVNYASFPSPSTHGEALILQLQEKILMKAWRILSARKCGYVPSRKEGLEWSFEQVPTHMLANLQGS